MKLLNTLLQITLRMFVVLLAFQACRLLFLLMNKSFYPDIDIWGIINLMEGGLRYDIAVLLIINIPYSLFMLLPFNGYMDLIVKQFLKLFFITINLGAIIFNIIDIFYFPYTMERLTIRFFHYLETQNNLGVLLWRFLGDYWYALIVLTAFIAIIVRGYNRIERVKLFLQFSLSRKAVLSIIIVAIYLAAVGVTSNWIPSKRLHATNDAWEYATNPFEVAAVTNTPYNMLLSIIAPTTPALLPQLKPKKYETNSAANFNKKNVVIFILESFTKEASGLLNPNLEDGQYIGYTPFLDSLMQHSYYFTHAYANSRRSIDAVPAILSSIPSILRQTADSTMVSIPSLLKKEGYTTQFFHGAHNGSMHFDKFCEKAGIEEYYGLTEFNNDEEFDGTWGIWDEPFLQYMAQKQLKSREPFISTVFNLSSHNPYVLPDKYEGKFKEGIDPICKCIAYADHSIRNYFKTASKMPWFNNTVFIFTADHSITPWHKEYATTEKAFAVPLFFYTPDGTLKGKRDRIAQHVDILPTILSYLKYPHQYLSIGNNLLDKDAEEWAITEIVRIPQFIEKGYKTKWIRSDETAM